MIQEYLFDITNIIDAAANGDHAKLSAYSEHLCTRLESNGNAEGASRIRSVLKRGKAGKLGVAKLGVAPAPKVAEASASVPVDSEFKVPMANEESFQKQEVRLFLPRRTKEAVDQFIRFYFAADDLAASGVGISPSMLMFGPPGCGKTQIAKYLASELNLPLITARADSLISSYLGSTAKNLSRLFDYAMSKPCILFLDELDALAKMRDDAHELGELKRVVISLLQNLDAAGKDHVILAATNHEHLLDPAIWRRFAYKAKISLPDSETRRLMAKSFMRQFATEESLDLIAEMSEGMSGATLKQITEDLIRNAVLQRLDKVPAIEAVQTLIEQKHDRPFAMMDLAEQVAQVRSSNSKVFTQKRLAELFGVSQSHISKILNSEVEQHA